MPIATETLRVEVHEDAAKTVVEVRGEVDLATVGAFEDTLCRVCLDTDGPVEVELSAVTHMCVRGLAALLSSREVLAARRRPLVLRGPRRAVRRAIALVDAPATTRH